MEIVKGIAWVAIVIVGLFVLGTVALLDGGTWNIVWATWMGFWVVTALVLELAGPSDS